MAEPFSFEVIASDSATEARAGRITTAHGMIDTPVFMPVGTQGSVKALTQQMLEDAGAQTILGNTYHLYLRPGHLLINQLGGLHRFISWERAILTDSGGFQVFSLTDLRRMNEDGVEFQSHIDGARHFLSPERSMEIQAALGSDIVMCFDECTPYPATVAEARTSLEITERWARRSKQRLTELHSDPREAERAGLKIVNPAQALFGINQGSVYLDLRERSLEGLLEVGFDTIDVGSFVSPKAIPQMVGSAEVLRGVSHHANCELPVLVPNEKGYEASQSAGAKLIAVFAAASESFSRANINCSIAESIERFKPVLARAKADGVRVRGYISTVLGCPYEGEIKPQAVVDVAKVLWDLGCYEISLGDTIGVGTPLKARHLLRAVAGDAPMANLAMHFHDTYGQALANLYAGMEEGCRVIDSAAGGLGGCPYAPGATGNVATEDVVYMLEGMGVATGVDMAKLVAATNVVSGLIGRPPVSRVAAALNAKMRAAK